MRAIVHTRYGPPESLTLREVDPPSIDDQGVLVRVRAASVNALDWHVVRGRPFLVRASEGLRRPRDLLLGVDSAGIVEAVGAAVTAFRPGDEVIGHRTGAFAELVAGRERHFVAKPPGVPFEVAAALPAAGLTALQAVRDRAGVGPDSRVLVDGAGGGVGTFAVQIAKALGASVTATTRLANVERARAAGADEVVDYAAEDVTRGDRRFDAVIDVAGRRPLGRLARVLAPGGILVLVAPGPGDWIGPVARSAAGALRSRLRGQRIVGMLAKGNQDDLVTLRDMLAAGSIRPLIDRTYPLERAGEAIAYVERGGASGKVVLTIA